MLRIPVANVIAILAGRKALTDYLWSLGGAATVWDKTVHDRHPAAPMTGLTTGPTTAPAHASTTARDRRWSRTEALPDVADGPFA